MVPAKSRSPPWRPALPEAVNGSAGEVVVPPLAPSTAYVLSALGLWRTLDGGGSWTQVYAPGGGPASQYLWADPLDPDGLWTSTRETLYRSPDGGASWQERTAGFPAAFVRRLAFDPFDPRKLYAVTSGGVYATVDE